VPSTPFSFFFVGTRSVSDNIQLATPPVCTGGDFLAYVLPKAHCLFSFVPVSSISCAYLTLRHCSWLLPGPRSLFADPRSSRFFVAIFSSVRTCLYLSLFWVLPLLAYFSRCDRFFLKTGPSLVFWLRPKFQVSPIFFLFYLFFFFPAVSLFQVFLKPHFFSSHGVPSRVSLFSLPTKFPISRNFFSEDEI